MAASGGIEKAVQAEHIMRAKAALRGQGISSAGGVKSGTRVATASNKIGSGKKAGGVSVRKMRLRKVRLRG